MVDGEQSPSLAERYRPRKFADVIGQEAAVTYLEGQARERTGRSVLLYGPSGCGKTVLAEIYATALLCQKRSSGEPCLRPDCPDCLECRRRSHPNWRGMREGTVDDPDFARAINADVDTESFGGGRLMILIDQAHRLSGRAFDVLHDRMERPPENVTFILCTTDIDEIPQRTRSLFRLLEVGPVAVLSRLELLRKICEKEGFAHSESALDLLARRAGGQLRQMIQDLEGLAERGTITQEQVRTFYEVGGARQISRYVERLLNNASLEQQMQALDAWDALPERKLSGIEAYLAELFGSEVLRVGRRGVILDLAGVVDQGSVVRQFIARGERLGMAPRQFCHEVLRFWAPAGIASDATLVRKISEFDELLNGPTGARSGSGAPSLVSARRKLPFRAAPNFSAEREGLNRRAYAMRTPPSGAGYLSLKQVRDLWEAASFLVQMYGLFLNTRISIRYGRLGIDDPKKVGPFLTSLMHELRMLINGRAASAECPEPFHWLYVREHSPTGGAVTHVVATVPLEAGDIGTWLRDHFVPHHLKSSCPTGAVTVRRPAVCDGEHFVRHLELVRLVCRGADPAYTVSVRNGDGNTKRFPLIERIGVPRKLRGQIGRIFGAKRFNVSRLIGPEARRDARGDLPPLSAFADRSRLTLDSGWELAEYEYRQKLNAERAAAEAKLDLDWPAKGGELALRRRAAELERFKEVWSQGAEARERNRPGMAVERGVHS
ncbi:MAG: AAA family ATPase [Armatimonadetes bacterium]|nr:AAA family ATPase [Armatimonadota bacterium]